MKNLENDSLVSLKKEDSRYGEKSTKLQTVKDHNKKDKYAAGYKLMNVEDLRNKAAEDYDYDYDDGYETTGEDFNDADSDLDESLPDDTVTE